MKSHLEKSGIFVDINSLFPELQGEQKVRVMSHNEKLTKIKRAADSFKRLFKFQKITYLLASIEQDHHRYSQELTDEFKHLPVFLVEDEQLYIRCRDLTQSIKTKIELVNRGIRTRFLRPT